jgi:predicted nucleic acid-binding Zn ribbon protein
MFKRKAEPIDDILAQIMRTQGLETPLLQRRLVEAWENVAGPVVARYTGQKFISNQTLVVQLLNPALRADLSMMRQKLVKRLNDTVGAYVISDIKFY